MLAASLVVLFLGSAVAASREEFNAKSKERVRVTLAHMNRDLMKLNSVLSELSWKLSTEPESQLAARLTEVGAFQIRWRNEWCRKMNWMFTGIYQDGHFKSVEDLRDTFKDEYRQFYLLCRGPVYEDHQNRVLVESLSKLGQLYETSKVCVHNGTCYRGEPDLERLMKKSRDPHVLLWAWSEWRRAVGPPSKAVYPELVAVLNEGAQRNGYKEIGGCWREELEVENLEVLVEDLYREVEPLYLALHAVVRFKLQRYYGEELISLEDPIPAHLLGNMWAQNWGTLLDIVMEEKQEDLLTEFFRKKKFNLLNLVKKAEDFFVSLGFRPMTRKFWALSKLGANSKDGATCHGTAANMFRPNDFRMILCAEITGEDFAVIHHEMGHIAYYMQYEKQPAILQEGVNSAFQESIGDAVMHGVISPSHLRRLGVIANDTFNQEAELRVLLHQALMKLPQIPFSFMLEKWRWNVFKGKIRPSNYNTEWWRLRERYQGVSPPVPRTEEDFDPASKFHINDNKPYIRYFLGSILQMQIFEAMCKATVFGENYKNRTLPFELHKCDIYGSKPSTENLRKVMTMGNSIKWKEALEMITGETAYTVRPLLDYYRPLYEWLLYEIEKHDIPVGWGFSSLPLRGWSSSGRVEESAL